MDASLLGVEGVSLKSLGSAMALRDGVLPLTFRMNAKAGATPLALGQSVTLVAA